MKFPKAEKRIIEVSMSSDEATDVISRMYKNASTPTDVSPEEAELCDLFKWSESPEKHDFWKRYE